MNEAEIWLSCKDDLVRYAAVLIGPADAEDVVSTVVVRVLSRRTLADLEDARRYLFKAVLNECRTRAVRHREAPTLSDLAEPPPPDPQPEVMEAVLSLPVAQRAATSVAEWEAIAATAASD